MSICLTGGDEALSDVDLLGTVVARRDAWLRAQDPELGRLAPPIQQTVLDLTFSLHRIS
jgi:hypothetical protein